MQSNGYIRNLIAKFESASADANAFLLYDGQQITNISYPQFANDILTAAGYFKTHNICGKHIALIAPNSYEWFVACFAIFITGNTLVAINPALSPAMIQTQCAQADVSIICGERKFISSFHENIPDAEIICFEEFSDANSLNISDACYPDPDKTILLLFTSGTTGSSKVVELSCSNLQHSIQNMDAMFAKGYMDSAISTVPLYHIAGIRGGIAMLANQKKLCMGRGIKYLLLDIPQFNPTYILLVPVMVENIVKLLKRASSKQQRSAIIGQELKRITVAGAALKKEIAQYLLDAGFMLDNVYAMTESTGAGTWCLIDDDHTASIGKASADMQCRISDGEILLKGPSIMKGYYKDPEETAKVIEDGWLHTGDMGYCDEDGYYYITGRKKNVIILSNGENVNPEEIEAKFAQCRDILECMVYSDGKGIRAEVYTENEVCVKQFIRAYNDSMPTYRQVYKVDYTTEPLEKTGSGKIKRKENK